MFKLFCCIALCVFMSTARAQDTITSAEVKDFIGKKVTLCDRVNYGRYVDISKNAPIRLYVGPDYPNHNFTLVIPRKDVQRFPFNPEEKMINKRFCVYGTVTKYRGKPAIVVTDADQLNAEE